MKKFLAFAIIILYFILVCIFLAEKTDVMSLSQFGWHIQFEKNDVLTWQRLPYPSYYEVEIFNKNPDSSAGGTALHLIKRDFTVNNRYQLPPTIYPTYYRIKAHGLFAIVSQSPLCGDPVFTGDPLIPTPISEYTASSPAGLTPYLIWHTVPNAIYYELELLTGEPDNPNGAELSHTNHLYSTRQVFTHGYQVNLIPFKKQPQIFWRVRGLDIKGRPVSAFSDAQRIHFKTDIASPQKPLPDTYDVLPDAPTPLYPVYQWLPMYNAKRYEVELLNHKPDEENDTAPSKYRIESIVVNDLFSAYDPKPLINPGTYYWRVRGLDDKGHTIGTWSDSQEIIIAEPKDRVPEVAVFGDSISHGGGSISYSPANLEYNYQTYLDFPTLNLARSGDTSAMLLKRFDSDVLPFSPRNLLIMAGTNSLRNTDISAQMIISDLKAINNKCIQNNIRPVFMTLTPLNTANIESAFHVKTDPNWKKKLTEVNDYIRTLPYYIDLEPYFYDDNGNLADKYSVDGLHPDISGKELMAAIINQHKDLFLIKQ